MWRIILPLVILLSAENSFSAETFLSNLTCEELKNSKISSILYRDSSQKHDQFKIKFYLSTVNATDSVEVKSNNFSSLLNRNIDFYSKTVVLIHGYISSGHNLWILKMKDKLINLLKVNVIVVDWSAGSYDLNYIDAALTTPYVSSRIVEFLEEISSLYQLRTAQPYSVLPDLWNHLYFIGHSLGAHISGQAADSLKSSKFWTVERITGLDPASPCFKTVDLKYKLDKNDACFVDVIHTQTGVGTIYDFGLKEDSGHADFYINGGVSQPECTNSWYDFGLKEKICSHKAAYKYFMNSMDRNKCQFVGHSWDGTIDNAEEIIKSKINAKCNECPELGINAVQKNSSGKYLVIAYKQSCKIDDKTLRKIKKIIHSLRSSLN